MQLAAGEGAAGMAAPDLASHRRGVLPECGEADGRRTRALQQVWWGREPAAGREPALGRLPLGDQIRRGPGEDAAELERGGGRDGGRLRRWRRSERTRTGGRRERALRWRALGTMRSWRWGGRGRARGRRQQGWREAVHPHRREKERAQGRREGQAEMRPRFPNRGVRLAFRPTTAGDSRSQTRVRVEPPSLGVWRD